MVHKRAYGLIQCIMDTIIYVKAKRYSEEDEALRTFHITPVKMWEVPHDLGGGMENLQLLYVTIPTGMAADREEVVREVSPKAHKKGKSAGVDIKGRWIAQLAAYFVPFFGYSASIETIVHSSAERYLLKECREQWQQNWVYPVFRDYRRPEFGQFLVGRGMAYLTPESVQVCVLSYQGFLPQLLKPYLKQIKSLTFFVTEGQDGLEAYLEMLYEEEGLAADLRILTQKEFCRLRPLCVGPTLVIDFSGEEKIIPSSVKGKLAWIDMDSNEGKKDKIMGRYAETAYFSMKEEWGRLDTAWKNRYNT